MSHDAWPPGHRLFFRADGSAWVGEHWVGRFPQDATHYSEVPSSDDPRWIPGKPNVLDVQVLTLAPFYPSQRLGATVESKDSGRSYALVNHPPFFGVVAWMPLDDLRLSAHLINKEVAHVA